jgi:hypothetical protein
MSVVSSAGVKGRVREAVICPELIDVPLMQDDVLRFSKNIFLLFANAERKEHYIYTLI